MHYIYHDNVPALNAAVSVFSIENLTIQVFRMLIHLLPVMFWLYLNKVCTLRVAAYLSGIFTAIYLTAQNLRMVMMTYGMSTPPHQTNGAGYIVGLVFTAAAELLLAILTHRLIKPEKIDTIDSQRVIMMSIVLFIMVYFKWILTAVRELSLGGNRTMMISFSLVTSIGLYLVLLLIQYGGSMIMGTGETIIPQIDIYGTGKNTSSGSLDFAFGYCYMMGGTTGVVTYIYRKYGNIWAGVIPAAMFAGLVTLSGFTVLG